MYVAFVRKFSLNRPSAVHLQAAAFKQFDVELPVGGLVHRSAPYPEKSTR